MNRRLGKPPWRLLIACTAIAPALLSACTRVPANVSPSQSDRAAAREAVRQLLDPAQRDGALCRLLSLRLYHTPPPFAEMASQAVNDVITAPQVDGHSMYVVFHGEPRQEDGIGPGQPHGGFTMFDDEGFIIAVFGGANFLHKEDIVFSPAGNGQLAILEVFPYAGGNAFKPSGWSAQVLHVIPITPAQRVALAVVLGPATYGFDDECRGFYWWWRLRDVNGDGLDEIQIGPRVASDDSIAPRATYRWSKATGTFEGPMGAAKEGFLRMVPSDTCGLGKTAGRFALLRRRLPEPGDPSAVRRPSCTSVTVGSIRQQFPGSTGR